MLNWVDFIIVAVFLGVAIAELKRGFGRAIFDLVALVLTMRAASVLIGPLSGSIKLSAQPSTNQSVLYAFSFLIIGGALVYLSKLSYDTTLLSAEYFEPLLGGVCGILISTILCHAFVTTIALAAGPEVTPPSIAGSVLGKEFLTFDTYHRLMQFLYTFQRPE